MGLRSLVLFSYLFHVVVLVLCHESAKGEDEHPYGVKAIYQFGDSLSDTGNSIYDSPRGVASIYAKLPYGQTYFHHATGRCTDGLVMVDYFARYFKLPFLDPYLKKDGNFEHGANFAVAGATALDISTLASKNISVSFTNSSLSVQLKWFRTHLNSICDSSSDCKHKLRNALFIMGEIGGNDINDGFFGGRGLGEVRKLVPEVIQTIKNAVKELIDLGAIRVVVPGNFPIGCMPVYLAGFESNDTTKYDKLNCLKYLNDFAKSQNDQLKRAIRELQKEYPHVAIVYGDYFYALRNIIRSATKMGFDKNATEKACCGGGDNAYNFDRARMCGLNGAKVCSNPKSRVSWDGVHLTSQAYMHMSNSLLKQITDGISHVTSSETQHNGTRKLGFISTLVIFLFMRIQGLFQLGIRWGKVLSSFFKDLN